MPYLDCCELCISVFAHEQLRDELLLSGPPLVRAIDRSSPQGSINDPVREQVLYDSKLRSSQPSQSHSNGAKMFNCTKALSMHCVC